MMPTALAGLGPGAFRPRLQSKERKQAVKAMHQGTRHPLLARLDVLVGAWELSVPEVDLGRVRASFEWIEEGDFLLMHSETDPLPPDAPREWIENSPFPVTTIIGLDDASERFSYLYADARGVHRVYEMTLGDRVWKIWRDAPGFSQRFEARISEDGTSIDGAWEMSRDGESWTHDFDLRYVKVS
jgi:hypothetical protein